MTDRQMKKLNRAELLELLLQRTRECDALREELAAVSARLEKREMDIAESGTMAEAVLKVNGVFDAAHNAAEQFVEIMRRRSEEQEAVCAKLEADAKAEYDRLIASAERKCRIMEAETQRRCDEARIRAEKEASRNWDELFARIDGLTAENAELRRQLENNNKRKWRI